MSSASTAQRRLGAPRPRPLLCPRAPMPTTSALFLLATTRACPTRPHMPDMRCRGVKGSHPRSPFVLRKLILRLKCLSCAFLRQGSGMGAELPALASGAVGLAGRRPEDRYSTWLIVARREAMRAGSRAIDTTMSGLRVLQILASAFGKAAGRRWSGREEESRIFRLLRRARCRWAKRLQGEGI